MRWGMVIDLDKCTACQACVVACRVENNVPFGGETLYQQGRAMFWMNMLQVMEGKYPEVKARFFPLPCLHCDKPPCTKVCPVGATYKNEEGLVAQIYQRCIGCRFCAVACPYTVRYFNWFKPQWPETLSIPLNPEVFIRPRGVVEKCSFCVQRIRRVKGKAQEDGRPIKDEEVRYLPACAESCPTKAIVFGDLDDPESAVSKLSRSPRAFRLLEDMGTEPKVYYLSEGEWRGKL